VLNGQLDNLTLLPWLRHQRTVCREESRRYDWSIKNEIK